VENLQWSGARLRAFRFRLSTLRAAELFCYNQLYQPAL
jgi:hypothetical protein